MTAVTKSSRIALVATPRQLARWKICAEGLEISMSEFFRQGADLLVARPGEEQSRRLVMLHAQLAEIARERNASEGGERAT